MNLDLRTTLLSALSDWLQQQTEVNAVWLEGADARDTADEWSDIDCCISLKLPVLEQFAEKFHQSLEEMCSIQRLEYRALQQRLHLVYEVQDSTPPLLLDVDLLFDTGNDFFSNDEIELPRIIFEKTPQITYNRQDMTPTELELLLLKLDGQIQQASRVRKYIHRNQYIEAFVCYEKYVLKPLITLLRLIYTPRHPEYYIVHISDHFPESERVQLEALFQVGNLQQLEQKLHEAVALYQNRRAEF